MIFFETFGLLLMSLIIIKFMRISRRLSIFYRILERPLILLVCLLISLGFIYCLLAFAASQIWGIYIYEFRRLKTSFYSMFTILTLHSN
jgi:hypothetical protein